MRIYKPETDENTVCRIEVKQSHYPDTDPDPMGGCFRIPGPSNLYDFIDTSRTMPSMRDLCVEQCQHTKYVGIKLDRCYCRHSVKEFYRVDDSECVYNDPCHDLDEKEECGGPGVGDGDVQCVQDFWSSEFWSFLRFLE